VKSVTTSALPLIPLSFAVEWVWIIWEKLFAIYGICRCTCKY